MQRYFADIIDSKVVLSSDDQYHLLRVMRMRCGDQIEVVSNNNLYLCFIKSINPLEILIEYEINQDVELVGDVCLFFPLAKGDKIELVIQKATELGVKEIVLINTKRCVVKYDDKDIKKKLERFNKIAKEASEQCHRLIIPSIHGVIDLKEIDKYKKDINLLAYEKNSGDTTDSFNEIKNKSVSIVIGPEGGFDEEEIKLLENKNFKTISLGKRILRCETAAIYALSVISYLKEK